MSGKIFVTEEELKKIINEVIQEAAEAKAGKAAAEVERKRAKRREILAITDTIERQKAIKENLDCFLD